MQTTRSFAAIPIDEAPRRAIARLMQSLQYKTAGVRWISAENLHLTIAFLGDVPTPDLPAVGRALDEVARGRTSIDLRLRGLGAFPNPNRPRIVWVGGAEGSAEVTELADAVQEALEPFGLRREIRPFAVHATIGRVPEGSRAKGLAEILQTHAPWDAGITEATEINLMASRLSPHGPAYSVVSRHPLGQD